MCANYNGVQKKNQMHTAENQSHNQYYVDSNKQKPELQCVFVQTKDYELQISTIWLSHQAMNRTVHYNANKEDTELYT